MAGAAATTSGEVEEEKKGTTCKERYKACSGVCRRCVQSSTSWLNRLVNRSTVTGFAICELIVAAIVLIFYLFFGRISGVSQWVPSPVFNVLLCYIRITSALVGAAAAWFRLVTRTRVYWALVFWNFVLSVFPGIALMYTECRCEYDASGWQIDEGQCIALQSFERLGRRFGAGEGLARRLSSLEEMAWLGPADDAGTGAFEVSLSDLLESFVVLDAGVGLNSTQAGALQLEAAELDNESGGEAATYELALRGLQCSGFDGVSESPDAVLERLADALLGCDAPDCGGVELRISRQTSGALLYTASSHNQTVFPTMTRDAVELAMACQLVQWDCNGTSQPGEACAEISVFLLRKVEDPVTFQTYSYLRPYCLWSTRITFGVLVVFSAFIPFMLVVIFKYFMGHCADSFELEPHEFDTTDNGGHGDDDDDWNVGTWISIPDEHKRARHATLGDGEATDTFPAGSFTSFAFRSERSDATRSTNMQRGEHDSNRRHTNHVDRLSTVQSSRGFDLDDRPGIRP